MKKKIEKLKQLIVNNIKLLKAFGLKYAYYDFCDSILFRKKQNGGGKYFHYKKHEYVKKYIKRKYSNIIENYENVEKEKEKIKTDSPIFVLWWQGEENAPEIIKSCINSIRRNAGKHKVNLITKYNYSEYVNIPNYIIKKVNDGKITITHLSDILRVSLLYEYGGIWIDATLYLTKSLDEKIYDYNFYTIKHNLYKDFHVCKGMWVDGFIASGKNNQLMKFMKEIFLEYWKNNNILICYLLIDCLLAIAYENIDVFKEEIENVPVNNTKFFETEKLLSEPFNDKIIKEMTDTYVLRTTYRHEFKKEKNNLSTFYNEILNCRI